MQAMQKVGKAASRLEATERYMYGKRNAVAAEETGRQNTGWQVAALAEGKAGRHEVRSRRQHTRRARVTQKAARRLKQRPPPRRAAASHARHGGRQNHAQPLLRSATGGTDGRRSRPASVKPVYTRYYPRPVHRDIRLPGTTNVQRPGPSQEEFRALWRRKNIDRSSCIAAVQAAAPPPRPPVTERRNVTAAPPHRRAS